MTTAELIARLQELDPTGEHEVMVYFYDPHDRNASYHDNVTTVLRRYGGEPENEIISLELESWPWPKE